MNTPPVIETGIPIPTIHGNKNFTNTLRLLKPGESIVVSRNACNSWRSCARMAQIKVVTRSISETESRIWRV